jgi:hypothetical protein
MANKQLMLPANRAFNSDGLPMAGAVVSLFTTGTLTPANFYSDSGLVTSLGSTLTANGAGRLATTAYQNETTAFRLQVHDADGALIDDIDPFYFGYLQGATGPAGPNATIITIGSVTTVAAGGSATAAVNSLGGGVYSLDLGIPRGANGGALSNGDYGDITVSSGGATLTIDNDVVTYAKMQNVSATSRIMGRISASAGDMEELTAANVATILDASSIYVRQNATLLRSIPIMAPAMIARTTNGAATGTTETATNKIMVSTYDFDASTNEYTQFSIAMPKSWDEGTVTAQFIWTATNTGDVVWQMSGVGISDGDVLDAAFGAAVSVTDSVVAANDVMISAVSSAMTIGGSPAEGDIVVFQVNRNAASGSDTCAVDAKLIGVRLAFSTNAKDDT